jgi:hypothetical protein
MLQAQKRQKFQKWQAKSLQQTHGTRKDANGVLFQA